MAARNEPRRHGRIVTLGDGTGNNGGCVSDIRPPGAPQKDYHTGIELRKLLTDHKLFAENAFRPRDDGHAFVSNQGANGEIDSICCNRGWHCYAKYIRKGYNFDNYGVSHLSLA